MTISEPRPSKWKSPGKKLYDIWAGAGGTYEDFFPYEQLSDVDKERWAFLAKAIGDPSHEHFIAPPADVQKYGEISRAPISWQDWDTVMEVTGRDAGGAKLCGIPNTFVAIPHSWPTYSEWKSQRTEGARIRWWQFWRFEALPTDTSTYFDELRVAYPSPLAL